MLIAAINFLLSPMVTRLMLGWLMAIPRTFRSRRGMPRRILIVRLDRIGDLVLNTPLLRELRANLPDAWITLLVAPGLISLMEPCPYVNEVLGYQKIQIGGGQADLRNRLKLIAFAIRMLWPRRFDLAISPRRDLDQQDAAMLCYLSGAARRIGFTEHASAEKEKFNHGFDGLFTEVLPARNAHEVHSNLSVLKHLGFQPAADRTELWSDSADQAWVDQLLTLGSRPIAICVGASYIEKQWPVDRFIEMSREMLNDESARLVIIGGTADRAAAEKIQSAFPNRSINIAGSASLRQTFAMLGRCKIYIGNDTGPMHLAAAAGIPVVEICSFPRSLGDWNPNSPRRFGPWGVPNVILQPDYPEPPCAGSCTAQAMHCILAVQTSDVLRAVSRLGV